VRNKEKKKPKELNQKPKAKVALRCIVYFDQSNPPQGCQCKNASFHFIPRIGRQAISRNTINRNGNF